MTVRQVINARVSSYGTCSTHSRKKVLVTINKIASDDSLVHDGVRSDSSARRVRRRAAWGRPTPDSVSESVHKTILCFANGKGWRPEEPALRPDRRKAESV